MIIRKATASDIPAIISIDHVATLEEERRQHIREWVSEDSAVVAIVEENVVGYAVLEYTFFSQGFIAMLIVQEANRRKGVGTALILHFERTCKTIKLFTSTNESNKPMQALMANLSHESSGVGYNVDEGDPELIFNKHLQKNR